jgi:hypothetical protein
MLGNEKFQLAFACLPEDVQQIFKVIVHDFATNAQAVGCE